ncbi:hypothetical protein [Vibrio alginolyticus]|uniref:hypothetical protein n=1 Tax=Vibrio alginolyticus TaxID=663 RepID=UPI0020A43D84|nr:hypothetical protein [Vibrio alginolyticus]
MSLESQLANTFRSCSTFHHFDKYSEILSPELIQQGLSRLASQPLEEDGYLWRQCFGPLLE